MINCLAYIDLNPVRSGIVEKPENYLWNPIGYHRPPITDYRLPTTCSFPLTSSL